MGLIDALRDALRSAIDTSTVREDEPVDEFVSPEDRVIRILEEYDGYTWQGDIADQLDWSEAKTSRTLCAMEEEGRITRYQIGRRNVVCLPHREPDQIDE